MENVKPDDTVSDKPVKPAGVNVTFLARADGMYVLGIEQGSQGMSLEIDRGTTWGLLISMMTCLQAAETQREQTGLIVPRRAIARL